MSARIAVPFVALAAIWGSSYLLIKYALEGFSALEITCLRTGIAGLVLWSVLRVQGEPFARTRAEVRRRPWRALLFGSVAIAAPFTLIGLGELEVPSGLTAVLIAPAPIFVALLAPLFDHSERIGGRQALGLLVGIVGVGLVVGIDLVSTTAEFLGALAVLAAALCYALAGFMVKRAYAHLPAVGTSAISCSVAAAVTLVPALAAGSDASPDAGAIAAVVALGVVHTALALALLYFLIGRVGAGRANLVNYVIPGVALAYGAVFRDEVITAAALAGLVLVLAGVSLASRRPAGRDEAEVATPAGEVAVDDQEPVPEQP